MRKNSCCLNMRLCAIIAALVMCLFTAAFAQESEYVFAYRSGSYAAYDQVHADLARPAAEILLAGPDGVAEAGTVCRSDMLEGREALKSFSSLNGSGGIYFGVVGAWTYPFALTELSTVSFGFQTTKSNAWFWGEGVSTTGITNSYVGRGSNVSVAGYPTVRVTGRWK